MAERKTLSHASLLHTIYALEFNSVGRGATAEPKSPNATPYHMCKRSALRRQNAGYIDFPERRDSYGYPRNHNNVPNANGIVCGGMAIYSIFLLFLICLLIFQWHATANIVRHT